MRNHGLGNGSVISRVKSLMFVQQRGFNPQVNTVSEANTSVGLIDSIRTDLDRSLYSVARSKLANVIDLKIEGGRIADIANGWNESRCCFMLMTETYFNNQKIAEEIYQGYTDRVDYSKNGSVVTLAPDTVLFFNKAMSITYKTDRAGNLIPTFGGFDNLLYNNRNVFDSTGQALYRPQDMVMSMHTSDICNESEGLLTVDNMNDYNSGLKISKLENEVGSKSVAKILKKAQDAKVAKRHTYGGELRYEGMIPDLMDRMNSDYDFLNELSKHLNRSEITSITMGDLERFQPNIDYGFTSIDSYRDLSTVATDKSMALDTRDRGEQILVDTSLNRFQKKITAHLMDMMTSLGFTEMYGSLTNKTLTGDINVDIDVALNISPVINNPGTVRSSVLGTLVNSFQSLETKELLGGPSGRDEVEIVFNLSLLSSVLWINLNGRETKVNLPTMCDSLTSTTIMDTQSGDLFTKEIQNVCNKIIDDDNKPKVIW